MSVVIMDDIMLLLVTVEPMPSTLSEESGFTWRTPPDVSELKICGVTL